MPVTAKAMQSLLLELHKQKELKRALLCRAVRGEELKILFYLVLIV